MYSMLENGFELLVKKGTQVLVVTARLPQVYNLYHSFSNTQCGGKFAETQIISAMDRSVVRCL